MAEESQWKSKFGEILQVCQDELKKTTDIGKKMLSASKANTALRETYEELGILVVKALKDKDLTWDNSRVKELLHIIEGCEKDLENIEAEVNHIRFSKGQEREESSKKVEDEENS